MPTGDGESRTVRLRLICLAPPPGAWEGVPTEFGLQDRQQTLHPGQSWADGSVHCACEIEARRDSTSGAVRLRGPFVHGPATTPFLYLGLRPAPPGSSWLRRLKISLAAIDWPLIEAAGDTGVLEATVSGAGSGTVPLLGDGWVARPRTSD